MAKPAQYVLTDSGYGAIKDYLSGKLQAEAQREREIKKKAQLELEARLIQTRHDFAMFLSELARDKTFLDFLSDTSVADYCRMDGRQGFPIFEQHSESGEVYKGMYFNSGSYIFSGGFTMTHKNLLPGANKLNRTDKIRIIEACDINILADALKEFVNINNMHMLSTREQLAKRISDNILTVSHRAAGF